MSTVDDGKSLRECQSRDTPEANFQLAVQIFSSGFLALQSSMEKLTAELERLNLALSKLDVGVVEVDTED